MFQESNLRRPSPERNELLVRAAARGDGRAWEALVEEYAGLVWAITRSHGLSERGAVHACQQTWLQLVESLERLDDPSRVDEWLAATTHHVCLHGLGHYGRHGLAGPADPCEIEPSHHGALRTPQPP